MTLAKIVAFCIVVQFITISCMEPQKEKANQALLAAIKDESHTDVETALAQEADPNLTEKGEPVLENVIRAMYKTQTPNAKLLKIATKLINAGARITDSVMEAILTSLVDRYLDLPNGQEFFESVLKKASGLNNYNKRGEAPLHTLLLKRPDYWRFNPMTVPLAARLLIQHGAHVNAPTLLNPNYPYAKIGNTPLNLASHLLFDIVTYPDRLSSELQQNVARSAFTMMEDLLNNRADPRIANSAGETPLSNIEWAFIDAKKIGLGAEVENIRTIILTRTQRLNELEEWIRLNPPQGQPITLYTQLLPSELRELILRYASRH